MRSFMLSLFAFILALNTETLSANGSESQNTIRSNPSLQEPPPKQLPVGTVDRPPEHKASDPTQSSDNEQRITDKSLLMLENYDTQQAQNKPSADGDKGDKKRRNLWHPGTWSLDQQIAAIASIAGLLQFIGLIATICVMVRTARRQLRAYVAATGKELLGPIPLIYKFSIVNHGQTPAYKVTDSAIVEVLPYPLPPNFAFPPLPNPGPSHLVLHSNVPHFHGNAKPAKPFTMQDINNAVTAINYRLYIRGVVHYVDIFNRPHTTRFCESHEGGQLLADFFQGKPAVGINFNTEIANQHNDAD